MFGKRVLSRVTKMVGAGRNVPRPSATAARVAVGHTSSPLGVLSQEAMDWINPKISEEVMAQLTGHPIPSTPIPKRIPQSPRPSVAGHRAPAPVRIPNVIPTATTAPTLPTAIPRPVAAAGRFSGGRTPGLRRAGRAKISSARERIAGKHVSRYIVGGAVGAYGVGAIARRQGPAADKPRGRPTGMYGF